MSIIANIIWIIFGGLVTAIGWCLAGIVFSITIIGIPLGRQCFKMASLTLAPFGKTIVYGRWCAVAYRQHILAHLGRPAHGGFLRGARCSLLHHRHRYPHWPPVS